MSAIDRGALLQHLWVPLPMRRLWPTAAETWQKTASWTYGLSRRLRGEGVARTAIGIADLTGYGEVNLTAQQPIDDASHPAVHWLTAAHAPGIGSKATARYPESDVE